MDITVAKSVPDMLKINLVNKKKNDVVMEVTNSSFFGGHSENGASFLDDSHDFCRWVRIVLEIVCLLL